MTPNCPGCDLNLGMARGYAHDAGCSADTRGKNPPAMTRTRTTCSTRRNRRTGTRVTVCESEQGEIEDGIPWMTLCEDHGSCVCHQDLATARWWAARPDTWCDDCREIVAQREALAKSGA